MFSSKSSTRRSTTAWSNWSNAQLILHSFDTEGYKLPDAVVDELVQERIRERFGDRVTFMKTLQAQGMTVEQFRKQVREQYIDCRAPQPKRPARNFHFALQD